MGDYSLCLSLWGLDHPVCAKKNSWWWFSDLLTYPQNTKSVKAWSFTALWWVQKLKTHPQKWKLTILLNLWLTKPHAGGGSKRIYISLHISVANSLHKLHIHCRHSDDLCFSEFYLINTALNMERWFSSLSIGILTKERTDIYRGVMGGRGGEVTTFTQQDWSCKYHHCRHHRNQQTLQDSGKVYW